MSQLMAGIAHRVGLSLARSGRSEHGAVGVLIVGVIIGVLLVIFGIIKFLIPGE